MHTAIGICLSKSAVHSLSVMGLTTGGECSFPREARSSPSLPEPAKVFGVLCMAHLNTPLLQQTAARHKMISPKPSSPTNCNGQPCTNFHILNVNTSSFEEEQIKKFGKYSRLEGEIEA